MPVEDEYGIPMIGGLRPGPIITPEQHVFLIKEVLEGGKSARLKCKRCGFSFIMSGHWLLPVCPVCDAQERAKCCPFCGEIPAVGLDADPDIIGTDTEALEIVQCTGCKASTGWRTPCIALDVWNARIGGDTVASGQDLPDLSDPKDRTDRIFSEIAPPDELREDIARMTPTLKPCPFCGGSPAFSVRENCDRYGCLTRILIVHCTVCDCQTGFTEYYEDPDELEDLAVAWNRRDTRPKADDHPR